MSSTALQTQIAQTIAIQQTSSLDRIQRFIHTPMSVHSANLIGRLWKSQATASLGLGLGMEAISEHPSLTKGLYRSMGWAAAGYATELGLRVGAKTLPTAALGWGASKLAVSGYFKGLGLLKGGAIAAGAAAVGYGIVKNLPEGTFKSLGESALYYGTGDALGEWAGEMHEQISVRRRGGFGAGSIQNNERIINGQQQALALLRQSRSNSLLGQEAALLHN